MKINIDKVTVVTLTLTEAEAYWLKNVMQNALTPDEDHEQSEMRRRFWEALQQVKD